VRCLERRDGSWRVAVGGQREAWEHAIRWVVNCAGLYADQVAELAGLDVDGLDLRLHWVKGNYFSVATGRAGLVQRLIYPVPPRDGTSLGIHVCLDRQGQLRLGPDVETGPRTEDYRVDPGKQEAFFASASRFLPFLTLQELEPAMSGLRPKLTERGFSDFAVRREDGPLEGLINLIGIDSPGLTSAPSLAEAVVALIAT
jgi:L-2-hydroxyglutarate oxidase LhgO